jgi:uncharacterized membrane protein
MTDMKKSKMFFWQFLICMIPFVYLTIIWHRLPQTVPVHFNARFDADGYESKGFLVLILIILALITMGVSMLLVNLKKVDPKQPAQGGNPRMLNISWVLVIFLTMISIFIIYLSATYRANGSHDQAKYLLVLICLLLVFLGNFINNVRPNYFVGIRTPWTLEDPDNWRKTHHLASKTMFFGGLVTCIFILILPATISFYLFMAGVLLSCGIPVWYSYQLFRKKKTGDL